jgi:hypothetical protein
MNLKNETHPFLLLFLFIIVILAFCCYPLDRILSLLVETSYLCLFSVSILRKKTYFKNTR